MEERSGIVLWLQDLNILVTNFEEELSNGYLLGQILYRYNFQSDFGQFSNKSSYSLSNISKVQLTLERFNLKFDPHRLINKEPGYAKKLLEKVHMALHQISSSPVMTSQKAKSITTVPVMTKDEKLMTKLQKFEDFRIKQAEKALEHEKNQREMFFQSRLKERSQRIEVLKSNKTFMQTWQEEGLNKWKKNQIRRKERINHENTINLKLVNDKKFREKRINDFHSFDANDGINEFEKNMIRLGIDYNGDTEQKVVKQDLAVEAAVTMAKIKENKVKNIEAAKEREIRQRNSHIQQIKNEKFEKYKQGSKRTQEILTKIIKKQLNIGWWYLQKLWKKIKKNEEIEKNVNKYKTLAEEKWAHVTKQIKAEHEALELSAKKEYFEKKKKLKEKMISDLKVSHENHAEICKPVAIDLILLADQAYSYLKENEKIPNSLWTNWLNIFKNKIESKVSPIHSSHVQIKPNELHLNYKDLTGQEYFNYIKGLGNWGPLPNNYYLGNILEKVIEAAFPLSPSPPVPEGPSYLPYKILVLGPCFSGKKTVSKKISENFSVKIFEMPKIIEEAKKIIQKKSEPEDVKKKKVVEEESEMFIQACLESNFEEENGRSKLFRAKIRGIFGDTAKIEQEELKKQGKKEEVKVQGYLLMNYPTTLQEAVDLERQLSGFIHPSDLPKEVRDIKKEETNELAPPSPKEFITKKMFHSAWDLVVYLDLDVNLSLKRAAERRIDPNGNIYNLLLNPPPDNILAKCKTIESPNEEQIKNEFYRYEEHKNKLWHWFSLFGYKETSNFLCVDANQSPDSITELIKLKINEINSVKNQTNVHENENETKLTQEKGLEIYRDWENLKNNYEQGICKGLYDVKVYWNELEKSLKDLLNDFHTHLCADDNKKSMANEYIIEFNNMIRTKNVFPKDEVEEIHTKIDNLSDSMWDIVNTRKQEFIEYRENVIKSYKITEKIQKFAEIAISLCQTELFRYSSSVNLIKKYKNTVEDRNYPETTAFIEFEPTDPIDTFLSTLPLKFLSVQENLSFLSEENQLFESKILKISEWITKTISEFTQQVLGHFEILDQWIIKSVELENNAILNFVKSLHDSLKSRAYLDTIFPTNSKILSSLL